MKWLFQVGSFLQRISKSNIDSLKDLQQRAEAGDAAAQREWGEKHYEGISGFARNYREAARWFQRAAQQGDSKAQANLGLMYYLGRGMGQDLVEAYKWIQLSSDQGNAQAVKALGKVSKELDAEKIADAKQRAAAFEPRTESASSPAKDPSAHDVSGTSD